MNGDRVAAARALPGERTIRFYVARGLVSPPEGRGTAATYGYRHLLQVLAIKLRQMEGATLDSLGKELATKNILVNAIAPAAAKTAIFDSMKPEFIAFMLSKIPMGRFGTPQEVAAMVTWLCTEDCSFSTGAVFDLSGGRATY